MVRKMRKNKKQVFIWGFLVVFSISVWAFSPFKFIYYYQKMTGELKKSYEVDDVKVRVLDFYKIKMNLIFYRKIENGETVKNIIFKSEENENEGRPVLSFFVGDSGVKKGMSFAKKPLEKSLFFNTLNRLKPKGVKKTVCFSNIINNFNSISTMTEKIIQKYGDKNYLCCSKFKSSEVCYIKYDEWFELFFPAKSFGISTQDPNLLKHFDVEFKEE